MQKFVMEFILHAHVSSQAAIKSSLSEFAEKVEVGEPANPGGTSSDFQVNIITEDPTLIFDTCSQFGRIKSAKINETKG